MQYIHKMFKKYGKQTVFPLNLLLNAIVASKNDCSSQTFVCKMGYS